MRELWVLSSDTTVLYIWRFCSLVMSLMLPSSWAMMTYPLNFILTAHANGISSLFLISMVLRLLTKRRKIVSVDINTMARMHLKPRLIFDRCIYFLIPRRKQVPTVRSLTDMIRAGLHERKMELIVLMDFHLTDEAGTLLDELFIESSTHRLIF